MHILTDISVRFIEVILSVLRGGQQKGGIFQAMNQLRGDNSSRMDIQIEPAISILAFQYVRAHLNHRLYININKKNDL